MMILLGVLLLLDYIYVINTTLKSMHMLQQNLYNENNRYIKWVFKNLKISLLNTNLYGILFAIFLQFPMIDKLDMFSIMVLCSIYIVSLISDRIRSKQEQNKKPLAFTKRIKRLMFTITLIYIIPLIIFFLNTDLVNIVILILAILTSLNYFVIFIANLINYPVERIVYHYYERKAKNKLKSMPNLKIVGITGSYGKTSSKNILNDILNIKYNCLATAKSINTFNGLMITINNQLSKFDDVFIAEMGAYVKGEINGLCKLVNPNYGIITSIGTAHLETFGSEENILNGKMELAEYLEEDGAVVFNYDDVKQRNYKFKKEKHAKVLWVGLDNDDLDVSGSNIKASYKGTSFDVKFKGDKKTYKFETKLLGKHNVYNILQSLALGREFGIEVKDLIQAVRRVNVVEHRLELRKFPTFYQIDDAYNSNPVGAKSALEVLDLMEGKKVVVTPGMIELGPKEEELNCEFGKQIADVADEVILIGEKRTKPIYNGLISKKYNKDKIHVLNDVRDAYTLLNDLKDKKDLYALFENDLPDTYTEIGGK
jgi:UDP-N-acetylmuramoyl-tripeptide--D-alanyl-D-alanine ligase